MKSYYVVIALLAVMTSAAAAQRTSPAATTGLVRITAADGDVRVRAGTAAEVRVDERERSRERGLRLERHNGEVLVDVFDDRDIVVLVPAGSRVDVRTRNGDVDISGITGTVAVETLSGDIVIDDTPASVAVESISGDVTVRGLVTNVRVATVSGDVDLARATGTIDASSTSGDLDIVSEGVRSGKFGSTSGTVAYRGTVVADALLNFTTSSGEINLEVTRDVNADFDIENVTGRIRSDVGPDPRRNRYTGGESLRFTNGRGGARIVVRNVSGEVYIMVR
jgi:DUF4097 and DUF4098 domain-containing protein YvlB